MTYYDHATAMAFKLDRWSDDRVLRNFEKEAVLSEQRSTTLLAEKPTLFMRCKSLLGFA